MFQQAFNDDDLAALDAESAEPLRNIRALR